LLANIASCYIVGSDHCGPLSLQGAVLMRCHAEDWISVLHTSKRWCADFPALAEHLLRNTRKPEQRQLVSEVTRQYIIGDNYRISRPIYDTTEKLQPREPWQIVIVGQSVVSVSALPLSRISVIELIYLSNYRWRHHWLHNGLLPHPPPKVRSGDTQNHTGRRDKDSRCRLWKGRGIPRILGIPKLHRSR
jgi:hypothetical protein